MYTRWGRTSCPTDKGTQLIYSGRAGGSDHNGQGGASNLICLPDYPEYSEYEAGVNNAVLRGVELRMTSGQPLRDKNNHNIPCAVCYAPIRHTHLMIPAKLTCPPNWTREYTGYLMAGYKGNSGRIAFECLDDQPESVSGLDGRDSSNALHHHVEVGCNSFSCPPYATGKEVACAVCTR